jgi:YHS domain-containing protein
MKKSVISLLMCLFSILGFSQGKVFTTGDDAIRGYDPVAYFDAKQPMKGSKDFTYKWNDATWYFTSTENLEKFKSDPEKYAPQFGGYCAYGMSNGYKAKTEPDAWTIVDGKLYLNYDVEVRKKWKENLEERISKAEVNWVELESK